ncbi:MAG: hypothetical protein AAFX50_05035, partial [Acidobacteriota bacterium]
MRALLSFFPFGTIRGGVAIALAAALGPVAASAQIAPTPVSDLQATGGAVDDVQTVAGGAFTLYTADSTRVGKPELWSVTNADGTARMLNAEDDQLGVTGFWPSPQGDRVAYELQNANGSQRRLFVVDISGGPSVPLGGPGINTDSLLREVKWTADGSLAVFATAESGAASARLFSSPGDGTAAVELTGSIATRGAVSGRLLGFNVEGDDVVFWGDLDTVGSADAYTVPAAGDARLLLSDTLPTDANVFHVMIVTPNGGAPTAVFAAANPVDTTLFTAPLAGGAVTALPEPAPFRLPDFEAEPILYVQNAGRIVYATLERR